MSGISLSRLKFLHGDKRIGFAGQLSATQACQLDATDPVFVAEIESRLSLGESHDGARNFSEFEKFPAVTRDIAMIVPETLTHEEIMAAISERERTAARAAWSCSIFSAEKKRKISERHESRWHIR